MMRSCHCRSIAADRAQSPVCYRDMHSILEPCLGEDLMRILVIGAGALGGYFGGCLQRAGRNVTFLVRSRRAAQLARDGLRISSPHGDFALPARTIQADGIGEPFDLILLAVKSYSLEEAMEQFAPAVGPATAILPVINGMSHIEKLAARFGADRVLGGTAMISATLNEDGHVVQLMPAHHLVFGELAGGVSDRGRALAEVLGGAGFDLRASDVMMQDMWEKWAGLASTAGITCLMRANLGDIIAAPGGHDVAVRLFRECSAVADAAGFPPRPPFVEMCVTMFGTAGSPLKASMLRDIERGAPTEGEHVLGDLAERARGFGIATPILDLARCHVAAYEASRKREAPQG
jgi:2-dehydropantoate 2-reductase